MRAATIDKAARFVAQGRVVQLPGIGGGVRLWSVLGDFGPHGTATYIVVTRGERARCSCPAGHYDVPCSHALAALYAAGNIS